jgi:hypothetical protein
VFHVGGDQNTVIARERGRKRVGVGQVELRFKTGGANRVLGRHANECKRGDIQCFGGHCIRLCQTDSLYQRVIDFSPIHCRHHHWGSLDYGALEDLSHNLAAVPFGEEAV